MPIRANDSHPPLEIVTLSGALDEAEYRAYLDERSVKMVERKRAYALIYDGSHIEEMPSTCRKLQSEWINKHQISLRQFNRGCGFVFPSALTRGLLTAVHWVSPPPYPHAVFAGRSDAVHWCVEQLFAAGDVSRASADELARAALRTPH